MNKHCSYNPHLPDQQINWGIPFGNEFLYNHPACLLGAFNWDKRAEIVSGWRQVVRRICVLCWIIHLTLLDRIEKHITSMTQVGMCVSMCVCVYARTQTFMLCARKPGSWETVYHHWSKWMKKQQLYWSHQGSITNRKAADFKFSC